MERKTRLVALFAIVTLAALAILMLLPSTSAYTIECYEDNERSQDAQWLEPPVSLGAVYLWKSDNGTTNQDWWKFNASVGQHVQIQFRKYDRYGNPEAPLRGATYYMKYEIWDPAYRPIHQYHLTYDQQGGSEYRRDVFGFVVPENLGGRYFIWVYVDPPQQQPTREYAYYFLNVTVEDPKDLNANNYYEGVMSMSDDHFVDYNWEDYYTVDLDTADLMTIILRRGVASQPFYLEVWEEIPWGSVNQRAHMLNRTQAGAASQVQVRFAAPHDGTYTVRVWRTTSVADRYGTETSTYNIECHYDTATLDGNDMPDQGPEVVKSSTIRNVPIEMGYDVHDWYRVQILAGDKLFRVKVDFKDYQIDLGHAYELVIYNGSGFLMWFDSNRDPGPSFATSLEQPPASATTIFDQDETFYVRVSVNTVDCGWGFAGFKANYDITFTLANRAPVLAVPFEDKYEWDEDGTISIELNSHFSDPEGDRMSYTVYNRTGDWTYDTPSLPNGYLNITSPKDWNGEVWWRLRAVDYGQTDERHYIYVDLRLVVRPVSDLPRSMGPISLTCAEETSASANLTDTFSDPDTGSQGVLTFGWNDTGQTKVAIDLDPVTGAMELVPGPDVFGVFTFDVWCHDDTLTKVTEKLTLTVQQINDVPRITGPIPKVEMDEGDDPVELDLALYFHEVDDEQLTYSWNIPISLSDDIDVYHKNNVPTESHIIIELLPDPVYGVSHWYGRLVLKITCTDETNTFVKQDLVIEVSNVPNPPIIKVYIPVKNPDAFDEGGTFTFSIDAVDDLDISELGLHTYTWWVDDQILVDYNESSYIFTTDYDSAGIHSVRVVVTDPAGLEAEEKPSWTFQVKDVNRAPTATITTSSDPISDEDTILLVAEATDPDGDNLEYTWYLIGDLEDTLLGTGNGLNTELPAGSQQIELEVKDGRGGTVKAYLDVEVTKTEEEGTSSMMIGIIVLVVIIVVVVLIVVMKMKGGPKAVKPEASIDIESLQMEYDPSQGRGGDGSYEYDPTPREHEGYERLR